MEGSSTPFLKDKTYLIAEAGATHTGLSSAKELVCIAQESGFDAVKFQIVESAKCPHPDELFNGHKCVDIWHERELTPDEWKELHEFCKGKIETFVTITDVNQVSWFPSRMYKIRSRDITKLSLISYVSRNCDVLHIDTGNANMIQIKNAVDAVEGNYILHHCPKGYPTEPENEHLSKIKLYKEIFKCPVAYSSHSNNLKMCAMAIALGADMLEVPIKTIDSKSISPENEYALNPIDAYFFVKSVRELERAL